MTPTVRPETVDQAWETQRSLALSGPAAQLSRCVSDEQIQQFVYIDAHLLDHFSRYLSHGSTFLF